MGEHAYHTIGPEQRLRDGLSASSDLFGSNHHHFIDKKVIRRWEASCVFFEEVPAASTRVQRPRRTSDDDYPSGI